MNILYVCPFSHGINISPELRLAHLVANNNNNVYFYTVKKSYIEFKDIEGKIKIISPPENVEMHYINNKFLISSIAYPFINPISEHRDLVKIVREKRIDLIHFYFPEHLICLPLLKKNSFKNTPIVVSINGIPGFDWFYGKNYVDFIGKIYSKIISSRIVKNVNIIIPYSTKSISTLISLGCDRNKIVQINPVHGIDTQFFKPSYSIDKLREKHGLPSDAFIVIYTGRFVEVKRLDLLIRAVSKIPISENIFLLLVGDGPLKAKLISQANTCGDKYIKFINFVDHSTLSELYSLSNMFALISSGEGQSSSLLEACATGLPALVSNVGASGDIIKDGINGYVLNMVTEDEIIDKILKIKKDFNTLTTNTRKYAIENLDLSIVSEKYIKLYSYLINEEKSK